MVKYNHQIDITYGRLNNQLGIYKTYKINGRHCMSRNRFEKKSQDKNVLLCIVRIFMMLQSCKFDLPVQFLFLFKTTTRQIKVAKM